jgi:sulfur carrier protein ThiS adenylyltransferase
MGPGSPRLARVEPDDDPAIRERLAASRVAIVGCGGLGSNAAVMLVRSGVGSLTLIDFDRVEPSNLNRQMFFADQLGRPKTEALADTLRRISPAVDLHLHQECVTADSVVGFVSDADVVIEAVDRAEVKAFVVNAVLSGLPTTPLVSASGLAGVDSANEIVAERVGDFFYLVGDLRSDVSQGLPLIGSRVMAAAAQQAHVAIRCLLGYPEP